jgi:hypothetical protein
MWSQAPSGPRVGEREIEAQTGSYVWKPRGVMHSFWNPGPDPARVLEVISPAGFERLFEDFAGLLERTPERSEEEVVDLCGRYGLTLDPSWVPDLEARFGAMRMV